MTEDAAVRYPDGDVLNVQTAKPPSGSDGISLGDAYEVNRATCE
jgi:hypothetical protein